MLTFAIPFSSLYTILTEYLFSNFFLYSSFISACVFGSGLIIFDENYNKRVKEIDSLQRKKYGFFVESTGCIIYEEDKYYNEAVDEYLQKRNGKNWENQYEKEVALIIKKYPIKEIER
jgi:2-keto-4-pentenoate hydratase/2-oxohepta-3-ene-1,7-dioic acid hydratase in catechol pathway